MEPYRYQPLSRHNDEIRVLELLPGRWYSPIMIRLDIEAFDYGDYFPSNYEAVSYAWGDLTDVTTIQVLDGKQIGSIQVTRQCSEALRYLRRRKKRRRLWIDAVCIDQTNMRERALQVQRMAWIFYNAHKVVAWIGPASQTSNLALDYIANIETRKELNPELVLALESLLHRPWFDRLWVWQETRFARECILLCDKSTAPFNALKDVVDEIFEASLRGRPEYGILLQRCEILTPFFEQYDYGNILSTLAATRDRKCLDPRDRVYIAQALEGDQSEPEIKIEPDYERETAEVYTAAVLSYIDHVDDLEFLHHTGQASVLHGLPTWVPDWSSGRPPQTFRNIARSSLGYRSVVLSKDYQVLRVLRIPVTTVRRVEVIPTDPEFWPLDAKDVEAMKSCLHRVVNWMSGSQDCKTISSDLFDTMLDVLTAGAFGGSDSGSTGFANPEHCEAVLARILNQFHERSGALTEWEEELATVSLFAFCRSRSLFQGDDMQIGLGPQATQPGDLLVVLLGIDEPVLLRETPNASFTVIGIGYHAKVMCGEAMLGELPEKFQPYWAEDPYDDDKRDIFFKNINTGFLQYVDPRLPPLSKCWKTKRYKRNDIEFLRYRNVETGEKRRYNEDPRYDNLGLLCDQMRLRSFTLV